MKVPYVITPDAITVHFASGQLVVNAEHERFADLPGLILAKKWDTVEGIMSLKVALRQWTNGRFVIDENSVTCDGQEVPAALHDRILALFKAGAPFGYLLHFWERLLANPSWRAVNELFAFLSSKGLPIGPDGHFYAYRSVEPKTYLDYYTHTIACPPGTRVEVPRNSVSDDPQRDCADGLHAGTLSYAQGYHGGACVVVIEIDPADVVSVPKSDTTKLRTCAYVSLGRSTGTRLSDAYWNPAADWTAYMQEYKRPVGIIGEAPGREETVPKALPPELPAKKAWTVTWQQPTPEEQVKNAGAFVDRQVHGMSVKEIRVLANSAGIKGARTMTKAALIYKLRKHAKANVKKALEDAKTAEAHHDVKEGPARVQAVRKFSLSDGKPLLSREALRQIASRLKIKGAGKMGRAALRKAIDAAGTKKLPRKK